MVKKITVFTAFLVILGVPVAYVAPAFIFNDYKVKSAQEVAIDLVVLPVIQLWYGGRQK